MIVNKSCRSLRVVDLDGGKIANISYESPSPPDDDAKKYVKE